MRLRLLVHGQGRGRGLGRLRPRLVLATALLACLLSLAACRRDASVEAPTQPEQGTGSLAVGISEVNPGLVWSPASKHAVPQPFSIFRDRLVSLRPRYYRLVVDWSRYQPEPGAPDLAARQAGCLRDLPPCFPYAGVREQLEALASAQRQYGGFDVLLVLNSTPTWAAAAANGCRPPGTPPAARVAGDIATYRRFVRSLLQTARDVGAEVRYWSAWNEPNHPAFLSPQRERCDTGSPPLSPEAYARLVRALRAELDAAPGDQQVVVGELAGYGEPRPTATSVTEFVDALPRDVVCASGIWSQHAYVGRRAATRAADIAGDADLDAAAGLLTGLKRSLAAKDCDREQRIWITETGVGGERAGRPRSLAPADLTASCRAMALALRSWYADPRVDAAFQYTFRDDNFFPVGLADTSLTITFPTYDLWLAWGGERPPSGPPPSTPAACR